MDTIAALSGKSILLGVCGSVSAYKAVDLASKLTQAGAQVDVIMTAAAMRFVTPLSFAAVTGRRVYSDMWTAESSDAAPTHIAHVGLAEGADLLLIAPATAHTVAKLALGMADDMLSLTALGLTCPIAIAPAMDGVMYQNTAVQANLETLRQRGSHIIEPEHGRFASGLTGQGRLPETATLIGHARRILGQHGGLAGHKLVVTAGGTREALDPVRHIGNRSTGKQGYAVAQAAIDAGAEVTLISAARTRPSPVGADLVAVESAADMHAAALEHIADATALVMAAAVADFKPEAVSRQKMKKKAAELNLPLARTDDILMAVKAWRAETGYPKIVVGFAAESENMLENAGEKLRRKGVDLMIANDITAADAGFAVDTNRVVALDLDGGAHAVDRRSKAAVGEYIIQRIIGLLD